MSTPNKESLENLVYNKVKDHEFAYSDEAWKGMQQKLVGSEKPSAGFRFRKSRLLISLLFLLGLSAIIAGYEFNKHPQTKENPVLSSGNMIGNHVSIITEKKQSTAIGKKFNNDLPEQYATCIKNDTKNAKYSSKNSKNHLKLDNKILYSNNINLKQELLLKENSYYKEPSSKIELTKLKGNSGDIVSGESNTDNRINESLVTKASESPINKRGVTNTKDASPDQTISFGLSLGYNYFSPQYLSIYPSPFDISLGAFINYPLNEKFSLQSGLGFSVIGGKDINRKDTEQVNDDVRGPVNIVTTSTLRGVNYLQVPIMLNYKLNDHFSVMGGLQFSYAIGLDIDDWIDAYLKDSTTPLHENWSYTTIGKFWYYDLSMINRISVEIPMGLQWRISNSFDFSAIYFLGLTDVIKPGNGNNIIDGLNNSTLNIRLSYRLMHKKFPGEL